MSEHGTCAGKTRLSGRRPAYAVQQGLANAGTCDLRDQSNPLFLSDLLPKQRL